MKIGPIEVWPPVVLAPMAGITNAPFRVLCREQGAGLFVCEMITTRALVELGVPYECATCGCDGQWQGRSLTLEVDHIDGDYRNNLKDNLRFLCPNCHRQTPNFAGRSRGKYAAASSGQPLLS